MQIVITCCDGGQTMYWLWYRDDGKVFVGVLGQADWVVAPGVEKRPGRVNLAVINLSHLLQ
jgi:hypothetical protein